MEFRPCIDIHNGRVKQIVGGSLKDKGDEAFKILSPTGTPLTMLSCIRIWVLRAVM